METKQTSDGYMTLPQLRWNTTRRHMIRDSGASKDTHSIEAPDGAVVCTYIQRNEKT